MTTSPKMDDSGLTVEQIEQWREWSEKEYPLEFRTLLGPKFRRLCDLALSALRQDSSGGARYKCHLLRGCDDPDACAELGNCAAVEHATPQESRSEVLEEAAKICDAYQCEHPGGMIVAGAIGRAIRTKIKPRTDEGGGK